MSDDEIKEIFDGDLNMTLAKLSEISGRSIAELKRILMS